MELIPCLLAADVWPTDIEEKAWLEETCSVTESWLKDECRSKWISLSYYSVSIEGETNLFVSIWEVESTFSLSFFVVATWFI